MAANSKSMVTGDASGVIMAEMIISTTYTTRQLPRSFLYGMMSKIARKKTTSGSSNAKPKPISNLTMVST